MYLKGSKTNSCKAIIWWTCKCDKIDLRGWLGYSDLARIADRDFEKSGSHYYYKSGSVFQRSLVYDMIRRRPSLMTGHKQMMLSIRTKTRDLGSM